MIAPVARMYSHIPVMLSEVTAAADTAITSVRVEETRSSSSTTAASSASRERTTHIDCTLGGAGHACHLLHQVHGLTHLVGFDPDGEAIAASVARFDDFGVSICRDLWQQKQDGSLSHLSQHGHPACETQVDVVHGSYEHVLPTLLSLSHNRSRHFSGVASILLDAGVSSHQLDTPHKGFSYKQDQLNPTLDMRFASQLPGKLLKNVPSALGSAKPCFAPALTAHDVINTWSVVRIADTLKVHGDLSPRIAEQMASAVLAARARAPIDSASQLASVLSNAAGHASSGPMHQSSFHLARAVGPAMAAIRIAVNSEMAVLRGALSLLPHLLLPGGVATVLTFQPNERQAVLDAWRPLLRAGQLRWMPAGGGKRGLRPSPEECATNPRAKPTTLFAVQRCSQ